MENINTFLRDNLKRISDKRMLIAPDIPEKKLNNAASSFKYDNYKNILGIYDNTLLGSAKGGILFTGELVIVKEDFQEPNHIPLADVEAVEYIKNTITNDKGKVKTEEYTLITRKDGSAVKVANLADGGYVQLAEILQKAIVSFDSFSEESQILTIAEMDEDLKVAYVKVLILAASKRSESLRSEENAEILQLMTRLKLTPEARTALRVTMLQDGAVEPLETLISIINAKSPASQNKSVRISLTKDLFGAFISVTGKQATEFTFLNDNKSTFNLADDEIDLAVKAVMLDRKLLEDGYGDDLVVKGIKELAARAASIGVPITAVYLSGSVVGLSAAGLTSGLATLGLGGILGFSGMVTGIGVAVILGVTAYKGVRRITGADQLDKMRHRELMLNDIIKHTQATTSSLIEDINHVAVQLNDIIQKAGVQAAQIQKLASALSSLTKTASVLNSKESKIENQKIKLRCPAILDLDRLQILTTEATKKGLYDFILGFYEEAKHEDASENTETKWSIKQCIPTNEIVGLAQAFEAIGYFNTSDVLAGKTAAVANKAGEAASKAKDKLVGMFR